MLTTDRKTPMRDGGVLVLAVGPVTKIYAGSLVAINQAGYAIPGVTALSLKGVGRAEQYVDNSTGAAGDLTVSIRKGIFLFDNSQADPVVGADRGNYCYIVDDHTVARTNGGNTRSVAGTVFDVDSDGVWVKFD